MPRERSDQDPVTTAFVIKKIKQWKDSGGQLKDLALAGKMAKSVPSQVLAGSMGVGAQSRKKFAKALGFADEEALRRAALDDWDQEQRVALTGPDLVEEVGREEGSDRLEIDAVKAIRGLQGGFDSREEIAAELRRQFQARRERQRDRELRELREATSGKMPLTKTEPAGRTVTDAGTDDPLDDFRGGASAIPKINKRRK